MYFGRIRLDQVEDIGRDLELVEVDIWIPQLTAEAMGHFFASHKAKGDDGASQRHIVLFLEILGRLKLVGCYDLFPY
jgi:hypothetical protein